MDGLGSANLYGRLKGLISACGAVRKEMKPELSIVIPAYNEVACLASLYEAIAGYVESSEKRLQFVFVDDGSRDDTFATLCSWSLEKACIKVVKLSRNFGSHAAIRAGIYYSDADAVMVYSSDMPEPIEDADRFYQGLLDGYELVYSVRTGYEGDFGSKVFSKLIKRFIDESYPAEGLIGVAFGSKIKRELNSDIESNSSVFFQIFRLGFSRLAISTPYCEREAGESKWTLAKKMKLFVDSFVMFSYAPIRVITGFGIAMAFIGLLWAVAIVVLKVFSIFEFAAGWPTMISILLVGFGITNISLGIIAEYLIRTLDAARNSRTFFVDEIIESHQVKE